MELLRTLTRLCDYRVACPDADCGGTLPVYVNPNTNGCAEQNVKCEFCGRAFKFSLEIIDHEVYFKEIVETFDSKPVFVLLQCRDASNVYVVLNTYVYKHGNEDFDLDKSYYYNEHTCPTNWLKGDVIKILDSEDMEDDPHGIFQYVATVTHEALRQDPRFTRGYLEFIERGHSGLNWFEVFKTWITDKDVIDAVIQPKPQTGLLT